MPEERARGADWDRYQWEGEGQGPAAGEHPAQPKPARWTKDEWVGDQGRGSPPHEDPDTMAEGDSRLSGDRHAPGEEHWARGGSEGAG